VATAGSVAIRLLPVDLSPRAPTRDWHCWLLSNLERLQLDG